MIQLRHISRKFDHDVLQDVSYDFKDSSVYVLKGISGSGKTTLLNILGGLDQQYQGSYRINNTDITHDQASVEYLRKQVGYMFQESLLFSALTALENLTLIHNDLAKIKQLASSLDASDLLDKHPEEMSNGERQRIALIRALIQNPTVILADEPSASLDQERSKEMSSLFTSLKQFGCTVVIATHDDCFDDIATEILHIEYGKIVEKAQLQTMMHTVPITLSKKKTKQVTNDLHYSFTRTKKQSKFHILLYSLIFLMFFIAVSIRFNLQSIITDKIIAEYPCHIYNTTHSLQELQGQYSGEIIQYDDYSFMLNDVMVHGLYDEIDSSFNIPNALSYGTFPQQENEILVDHLYVSKILQLKDDRDALFKEINIQNTSFIISGIITEGKLKTALFESEHYFTEDEVDIAHILIPYKTIQTMTSPRTQEFTTFAIRQGKTDESLLPDFLNYWYQYANNITSSFVFFMNIFIFAAIVVTFVLFVFLLNIVRIDLLYRRKEIGYMRIFSLSKTRISRIIFFDYFLKIAISLLTSNILFMFLIAFIYFKFQIFVPLSVLQWLCLHFILIAYIWILTRISLVRIFHKPIIKLIKE